MDAAAVDALSRDPEGAPLPPRSRALAVYAVKLTRHPRAVSAADVDDLRAEGLSDAAIHDAATVTAYFNFVNRIAQGLGVELEKEPENSSGR